MPRKDDNRKVKEVLTDRDISDLKISISNLALEVKRGFDGVHARQDTTNGKVLKAGNDITDLKAERSREKFELDSKYERLDSKFRYNRIIWYLFTAALVLITGLIMFILNHK